MNQASATAKRSPLCRALQVALAVATVLVLTACGARIDTTMTVSSDGSGSRVMVLTLGGDDMANLVGGSAAVDASIKKNLPAELTYSRIQPTPDGGVVVTLTLSFASSDEYLEKAQALLTKSGNGSAGIEFSVTDSLLLKGIVISEDFSSYDLVKWMFDGLLDDGVVPSSNASDMYEVGNTVLNYGGTSVSQNGSYEYSSVVDNGFDAVSMATDVADVNKVTRTITFTAAKYAANQAVYDEYFTQSTPIGANVTMAPAGTWKMTFTGDAQSIALNTDKSIGSAGSEFSIESGTVSDDPATLTMTVTDVANCANICATDSAAAIHDTVSAGAEYTPRELDVDMSAATPVRFDNAPPIKSIDADFNFGNFGSVEATVQFVVSNKDVALVGDGFTELFEPEKDVGTVTVKKGATDTTFTTVINAKDASAFESVYAKWAPGSSVSAIEGEGSNIFGRSVTYAIDPGLSAIIKGHEITGANTISIGLPFGQRMTSASGKPDANNGITGTTVTYQGANTRASFQASGPTLVGLLLIGSLVLAVVSAVILLVKYRRQVRSKLQAAQARFGEGMEPSGLGTLSASRARPASTPWSKGTLFGLPSIERGPLLNQSILDWPAQRHQTWPSVSLSSLAKSDVHRSTVSPPSLFTRPAMKQPRPSGGNLFDHPDAFGTGRPRNTTN